MRSLTSVSILLLIFGCRTSQDGTSLKAEETQTTTALPNDPTKTKTPFHHFECSAGDYQTLYLGPSSVDLQSSELGLQVSNVSVIGEPNVGSTRTADDRHNVRIDFCFDNDTPYIRRIVAVLPNVR